MFKVGNNLVDLQQYITTEGNWFTNYLSLPGTFLALLADSWSATKQCLTEFNNQHPTYFGTPLSYGLSPSGKLSDASALVKGI